MNETFPKDAPGPEQVEVEAAGDLAAAMAKGPMFTNDDTTDDPGLASNGETLASQGSAKPAATSDVSKDTSVQSTSD